MNNTNSTSETDSSRPSRKRKPRNFEDFHVFDNHLQGLLSAIGHGRLSESNTDTKDKISDKALNDCRKNAVTSYVSEKGDTVQETGSQIKPPAKRGRPRKLVTDSGKQQDGNDGNLVKGLPFCNSEDADPSREADRLAQTSSTVKTDNELGTIADHHHAGSARKRGRPKKCHKNNSINLTSSSGMGKGSTDDKSQSVIQSKSGSGQKRSRSRKINIETGLHADDTDDENNKSENSSSVNKSKVKSITDSASESADKLENRRRKRKISGVLSDESGSFSPDRCAKNSGERSISKRQRLETSASVDQLCRGKSRREDIDSDTRVKTGEICSVDPISHVTETNRKELVSENETGSETCQEADTKAVPVSTPKRKGRPPKFASPRSRPTKARDSPKVPQLPVSSKSNAGSLIVCQQCGHSLGAISALKAHMMAKHSLVWDKDHPEGISWPSVIIKRLGYIDCQRCMKRFKFPQYYKHHTIWCGREDETATCEICNSTMRAMWLQQHLTAHKTKEKQQALEEEKRKAMEEEKKKKKKDEEDDEEKKDDANSGDPSGVKKSKRQAAKSALKLMSDLNDLKAKEVEAVSTEEDYKQSDESSEEDTNDEGEEEEDSETQDDASDDSEDGGRQWRKKMSSNLKASPVCEQEWYYICEEGADFTADERLKQLHTFYTSRSDGRLFAEMCPQLRDWLPQESREAEEFYHNKNIVFTCGQTKKTSEVGTEETSLSWGQTAICNGKVYCYTGGPIWAVEWCPLPESVNHNQVVAIAADLTTEELSDTHTTMTGPGLVQIWSMGQLRNTNSSQAEPSLEYSIAHSSGYVRGLSWCPVRCFDKEGASTESLHRLGLLAVACSDGSVLIYSLPKPSALNSHRHTESRQPASKVYRPRPTLTLICNTEKGCGPCLCVSWQQGGEFKYIIGGYGCGAVFLWDLTSISPLLRVDQTHLRPLRTFLAHDAAVVSCTWNPRSPSVFATSSFDHKACMWDAERPLYPNSSMSTHASFPVHHSLCWAGPMHPGFFSASERLYITDRSPVMFHGIAKMARRRSGMAIMVQHHTACVWDVSFCPFYEVLVSCDAVGKVKVSLPPMAYLRCRTRYRPSSWVDSKVLYADLYQAQIKTRHVSTSSSAQPLSSASNISQKEHKHHTKEIISYGLPSHSQAGPSPSTALNTSETGWSSSVMQSSQKAQKYNGGTSASAGASKSDINTEGQTGTVEDSREENILTDNRISSSSASDGQNRMTENVTSQTDTKPSHEETLHFQESELTKLRMKVFKNVPKTKCELEDFGGSNTNAIHKVRFSPNPSCCLWLASGGQAGLLRLDNLIDLVQPHTREVRQFYNKYNKYRKHQS